MSEEYVLFPFLLLIDTSSSMSGDPITAVNAALPELLNVVRSDPQTEEVARIGITEFNTDATQRLPISDLQTVREMPTLTARGTTNYANAFSSARDTLNSQLKSLKQFYRPIVFFLSDGNPTDPSAWPAAFQRLTDATWKYRPSIVAFGFGDANADVIRQVGTRFAFMARDTHPATAVKEIFNQLLGSIISTSQTGASESPGLTLRQDINDRFEALPVIQN